MTSLASPVIGVLTVTVVLSCNTPVIDGANILGLFTSHSQSHLINHMSIVKVLAERGHNVTVVSSMKPIVTHKNIRHILIPPTKEQEQSLNSELTTISARKNNVVTIFMNFFGSLRLLIDMQSDVLKDERFTVLYENPETKFDLVMVGYFMNTFQLGVAAKFQCPIIVNWLSAPMLMINSLIGNPAELAYVPNMNIAVKAGGKMSFLERVQNLLTEAFLRLMIELLEFRMERFYKELFSSDENFPSYQDMRKNVSLIFCNSHFSEGPIRPNVPAIVEIGGIQIKQTPNSLPEDIASVLDNAEKSGAILFTLGSNVKSANLKPEIVQVLYNVLSGLRQQVIWKWENLDNVPGNASNILYKQWLPQDDILAHRNLRLFITHAGKGGIAEAQYHGVPMVALPIFADQHGNAKKMVASGYGQQLQLLQLSEDSFRAVVLEVLENPYYAQNVKKFSKLYRDRPSTAQESVAFWTEYVMRHHGAPHMQSPLVYMNFIQSMNLDVVIFLVLIVYCAFRITKFGFKYAYRRLREKYSKPSSNMKVKKQ